MTLRADTEEKKRKVLEIADIPFDTCCNFPFNPDSKDFSEYDDRIYLDGIITFDEMAKIVDFLRGK